MDADKDGVGRSGDGGSDNALQSSSRIKLSLSYRQIHFWFQNKRTQFKAQQAKADNTALRLENDNIQRENNAMKEDRGHKACPSCRGPSTYTHKQKMFVENAHLREELHKVSSTIANYIGRPISQLHLGNQGTADGPSVDLLSRDSSANQMWPFGFVVTNLIGPRWSKLLIMLWLN
ncbi:hypothetical protein POM88_016411 [Heracleum sosnowskyi]|uniref:Homeobox domain-containing protein n=1 Tax=Heracleum sosnowskyi TaxID=360622 RepID=A0AAD8MYF1_9APIA|nr:hypothetical protein POM88_016411 [Heracleum sosnowskyi]